MAHFFHNRSCQDKFFNNAIFGILCRAPSSWITKAAISTTSIRTLCFVRELFLKGWLLLGEDFSVQESLSLFDFAHNPGDICACNFLILTHVPQ
jgi:hypothetical protein